MSTAKRYLMLGTLALAINCSMSTFAKAASDQFHCGLIEIGLSAIGEASDSKQGTEDITLNFDYLNDPRSNTRCLMNWLSNWDQKTPTVDLSAAKTGYADYFFQSTSNSRLEQSADIKQITAIVGALRALSSADQFATQRAIRDLEPNDALRAMNVLGWLSKSRNLSLRLNSTLFLGNAITNNGECAYFSHAQSLERAKTDDEFRSRANILAVGGVYAARRDLPKPNYILEFAKSTKREVEESGNTKEFENTLKSVDRILNAYVDEIPTDNAHSEPCLKYFNKDRFLK